MVEDCDIDFYIISKFWHINKRRNSQIKGLELLND